MHSRNRKKQLRRGFHITNGILNSFLFFYFIHCQFMTCLRHGCMSKELVMWNATTGFHTHATTIITIVCTDTIRFTFLLRWTIIFWNNFAISETFEEIGIIKVDFVIVNTDEWACFVFVSDTTLTNGRIDLMLRWTERDGLSGKLGAVSDGRCCDVLGPSNDEGRGQGKKSKKQEIGVRYKHRNQQKNGTAEEMERYRRVRRRWKRQRPAISMLQAKRKVSTNVKKAVTRLKGWIRAPKRHLIFYSLNHQNTRKSKVKQQTLHMDLQRKKQAIYQCKKGRVNGRQ